MNIKVGDTVRVVNAEDTYGSYQNGDTATVVEIAPRYVRVSWLTRTPTARTEGKPVSLLFLSEFHVIKQAESPKVPNLYDWAKHYAISPAALEALTKLLGDGKP